MYWDTRAARPIWLGFGLALLALGCTQDAGIPTAPEHTFVTELRGNFLHHLETPAFDSVATIDRDLVIDQLRAALQPRLDAAAADQFVDRGRVRVVSPSGAVLTHLSMEQSIGDVPIRGTWLNITLRQGDGSAPPLILASSYHLFAAPEVDLDAVVSADQAVALARTAHRVGADVDAVRVDRVIREIGGRLELVWDVGLFGVPYRSSIVASGSRAGHLDIVEDRIDATGSVVGNVAMDGAPGSATPGHEPLAHLYVTSDAESAETDGEGLFSIAVDDGQPVSATLSGRAAVVYDQAGANLAAAAEAADGMSLVLGADDAETTVAQATAYYFIENAYGYLTANGIAAETLGEPLTTQVNIADVCNAYYYPAARSINFFQSGSSSGYTCNNSAEASIVMHEYGHFVDDMFGGITEGGLSEGWGDTVACFIRDNPVVGGDLFTDGTIIRTCDNDYQYPASGSDEVHALGQAWAGFTWHARAGLIAKYGDEGKALAEELILPSLASNAADIPAAVREVFLRDDDDGDMSNQTPDWDVLYAAAEQHSLSFVIDELEWIAPDPVTDLTADGITSTQATLHWTATGDDGMTGVATAYDLRIADTPIDEATFAAATPIPAPQPLGPGQAQELTITLTPNTTVYVALQVIDDQGNRSPLSNVATITPGPVEVFWADGAENGLGAWQATGLWHVTDRRAAEASHSFWYGDEATGNYNTGSTNSGQLLSPVIDLAGTENPALFLREYVDVEELSTYDQLTVTVYDENDPSVAVSVGKDTGQTGDFRSRLIPLAGLADRQVRIQLSFDTVDDVLNDTEGWFVDDIQIIVDSAATPAELMINEVLADPPPGYDANGDGVADTRQDEFLEIVNAGDHAVDLSGATIEDEVRVRYTFPDGVSLAPGGALVVFGGGAPAAIDGVQVYTAAGLYLNNDGDTLRIRRVDGELLAQIGYGGEGGDNQSLVRQTDADPNAPMVGHLSLSELPASPGTRTDGSPFGDEPPPPPTTHLLINEVLADPPAGYDANADGEADTRHDEFVEILNTGDEAATLTGMKITDALGVRFTFPELVLEPGGVVVVFGGGTPALPGIPCFAASALNLNNTGDTVSLLAADDALLDQLAYGGEGGQNQSMVRVTDGDPDAAFGLHAELSPTGAPASPGTRIDGSAF